MNTAAVLVLIGDLYAQIDFLQRENGVLKEKTAELDVAAIRRDPLGGPEEAEAEKQEPEFPRKADPSDFVYDALGGPEEAAAAARAESEAK